MKHLFPRRGISFLRSIFSTVVTADRKKEPWIRAPQTQKPRPARDYNLRGILRERFGICFLAGHQDLEILVRNTKKAFRLSGCWHHRYLFRLF